MITLILALICADPKFPVPDKVDRAVVQGLNYLATQQDASGMVKAQQYRVCITALSGMAWISHGSTPREGRYANNLKGAIDYILLNQQHNGILAEGLGHHMMYEHGFTLLFLCEVYGQGYRDDDLRLAVSEGVDILVSSQHASGGWRYKIPSIDADLSVTVAEVIALRAAKNCGIKVPTKTIKQAAAYIKSYQLPEGRFKYTKSSDWDTGGTRTGGALVALHAIGIHDGKVIEKARKHLWRFEPGKEKEPGRIIHYFYAQYYAAAAVKQQGGKKWRRWYDSASKDLMKRRVNGRWSGAWYGDTYCTALACIILQLPNDLVPIFQE